MGQMKHKTSCKIIAILVNYFVCLLQDKLAIPQRCAVLLVC